MKIGDTVRSEETGWTYKRIGRISGKEDVGPDGFYGWLIQFPEGVTRLRTSALTLIEDGEVTARD